MGKGEETMTHCPFRSLRVLEGGAAIVGKNDEELGW